MSAIIQKLIDKGVVVPDASSVYVAPEVDPDRIHPQTVLHPGCRLHGSTTSIGPGCAIGLEGAVTLRDCQLDAHVQIRGGYANHATILEGADCGDGSHIRPGTLLEEYVVTGHSNGLKQTILMPFVAVGSLTNFCDVMMAGGSSSAEHSEVGSSYVHFNFTPHQDKATASLVGDVPHGVLLDQAPIFLGGQGGIVGPRRIAYGTVIAAGIVVRKDVEQENMLMISAGGAQRVVLRSYCAPLFGAVDCTIANNMNYIGNLFALQAWYGHVRRRFLQRSPWGAACLDGAHERLAEGVDERIQRLGQFAAKLAQSVQLAGSQARPTNLPPFVTQERFAKAWPEIHAALDRIWQDLQAGGGEPPPEVEKTLQRMGDTAATYIQTVQALPEEDKDGIRQWLQTLVNQVTDLFPV